MTVVCSYSSAPGEYILYFFLQSLDTSDLQEVGVIHKPDFVAHPDRYFSQSSAGKRRSGDTFLPSLPVIADSE